jgi:hypothetical protein
MNNTRLNTFSQRHFVWLLWLVLLLPLGQTTASWHVLSHVHSSQAAENDGQQTLHQDHCDLCLSAATLIGGGPLACVPDASPASGPVEVPQHALHNIFTTAPAQGYDSQAPPFSSH